MRSKLAVRYTQWYHVLKTIASHRPFSHVLTFCCPFRIQKARKFIRLKNLLRATKIGWSRLTAAWQRISLLQLLRSI